VIEPVAATGAASPAAATTKTDARKQGEAFERILLGQLTKTLVDSALPADGEGAAATDAYKGMLPDALTEALVSGGGIGLASALQGAAK
jgi:hypothetical protein